MDKPVHEQYIQFILNRMQGDFGPSYKYAGWDVDEIIAQAFPVSLELGLYALMIALIVGIPLGIHHRSYHKSGLKYP